MGRLKHLGFGGSERLGLAMILASLLAIMLIVFALLWHQNEIQEDLIRSQGLSLTRTISALPYTQLVPPEGKPGLISNALQGQHDPNFAYAVIVDINNKALSLASAPGVTVPSIEWPAHPVGWLSDRMLKTSTGKNVVEFYSPLYSDGSVIAYLRVGYFLPGQSVSLSQLPFLATMALIIFLLTPIFYFLMRKEVAPLRDAHEKIGGVLESSQFSSSELRADGELNNFFDRFSEFVDFAKRRIDSLEAEQKELITSQRLITYSKARIENVLEAIPEAVLILDQTGAVSYGNRRLSTLIGVPHEKIAESNPSEWCDNPEIVNLIAQYSGQNSASYLADTIHMDVSSLRSVNKDTRRNLAIKAYPLFSPTEAATIYGTLIIFRDVTKESIAQRQQGEFIAHVAHELKTPLNTLALCSQTLLDNDSDDSQTINESANIIRDEVERLAGLIDNLLNVTKIESGDISVERQRLRLRDFLEDTFSVAKRYKNAEGLTFELDIPPDVSSIMADKELLRIAVNNLLTNAVKYSHPGGVVSVSCEETEQTIRILVKDSGMGIKPEEQKLIFDRFYRSSNPEVRAKSGHGLGLSLARDIIELHQGTLSVSSAPGEGSEFTIEIWKESGLLKQVI